MTIIINSFGFVIAEYSQSQGQLALEVLRMVLAATEAFSYFSTGASQQSIIFQNPFHLLAYCQLPTETNAFDAQIESCY
ncbi:MAG: hypothetical protein AAF827_11745 [Cyanobacteria bacterium P01_D01_bin.6]